MTLDQLNALHAVVERQSMQLAAQSLHKTQPAISIAIKKLETEVGFEILQRDQYRVTLTERGEELYQAAKDVLNAHKYMYKLSEHLAIGNEAVIKIAYDAACYTLPFFTALRQIQQKYPQTQMQIFGEYRLHVFDRLREGKIDLAIAPWSPMFMSYGNFETFAYSNFKLVPMVSRRLIEDLGYPPKTKTDLEKIPMLVPEKLAFNIRPEQFFSITGRQRVKVNDSLTQKNLLMAGLGWGLLPEFMAKHELETGELVEISIPEAVVKIHGEIHIVRNRDVPLGPVAQEIWELFRQQSTIQPDIKI
ncbi:LysR family transcriptional regulator [Algicola sagamiensis]|uniref:LysR family transcriptional regulator n=1 Tax=Algicola sagamiensis TaxID=163869 RepID=UPI000372562C|nr:LysR family transcriptional regulator [Algicola sagamiensis]